jgi:outer membrane protein assembly factor BamB
MRFRGAALFSLSLAGLMLAGCDTLTDWVTPSSGPPLPGKRVAVMAHGDEIKADPVLAASPLALPPATANADWPQRGGSPEHALGNLALADAPREIFHTSIGSGGSDSQPLIGVPVVAGGTVFAIDASSTVSAVNASTGGRIWSVSIVPDGSDSTGVAGGGAYADGKVFVVSGFGEVVALNASNGEVVWRKRVSAPVRGAPTVAGGRVFAVTLDNQLYALSADKGDELWTHPALQETADVLGGSTPAVTPQLVVAPFSSGELVGLRPDSGRGIWQEALSTVRSADAITSLSAIVGLPVIDRGLVIAISQSGRMVALDERSGSRVWELPLGGTQTPWAAGDTIFVMGSNSLLAAINRKDGKVRWTAQLPEYQEPDRKRGIIVWAGPVVAGGRLWLASSLGELWTLSPTDGHELGRVPLPGPTYLTPVVAGGTLYVLSDNGTLSAFR